MFCLSACYVSYFVELGREESLAELFRVEKSLFVNNFPQVPMVHAVSATAANFDLVIDKVDGCGIPILIGNPVSGKSTALKVVLSVFGDTILANTKLDNDSMLILKFLFTDQYLLFYNFISILFAFDDSLLLLLEN